MFFYIETYSEKDTKDIVDLPIGELLPHIKSKVDNPDVVVYDYADGMYLFFDTKGLVGSAVEITSYEEEQLYRERL